jgi:PKD repeat protein
MISSYAYAVIKEVYMKRNNVYGTAVFAILATLAASCSQGGPTTPASTINAEPIAVATTARAPIAGVSFTLDGTKSTDEDGTVVSWHWDLGNGSQADGATAQVSYGAAGSYTVTLTVTDDDGAKDSEILNISVSERGSVTVEVE